MEWLDNIDGSPLGMPSSVIEDPPPVPLVPQQPVSEEVSLSLVAASSSCQQGEVEGMSTDHDCMLSAISADVCRNEVIKANTEDTASKFGLDVGETAVEALELLHGSTSSVEVMDETSDMATAAVADFEEVISEFPCDNIVELVETLGGSPSSDMAELEEDVCNDNADNAELDKISYETPICDVTKLTGAKDLTYKFAEFDRIVKAAIYDDTTELDPKVECLSTNKQVPSSVNEPLISKDEDISVKMVCTSTPSMSASGTIAQESIVSQTSPRGVGIGTTGSVEEHHDDDERMQDDTSLGKQISSPTPTGVGDEGCVPEDKSSPVADTNSNPAQENEPTMEASATIADTPVLEVGQNVPAGVNSSMVDDDSNPELHFAIENVVGHHIEEPLSADNMDTAFGLEVHSAASVSGVELISSDVDQDTSSEAVKNDIIPSDPDLHTIDNSASKVGDRRQGKAAECTMKVRDVDEGSSVSQSEMNCADKMADQTAADLNDISPQTRPSSIASHHEESSEARLASSEQPVHIKNTSISHSEGVLVLETGTEVLDAEKLKSSTLPRGVEPQDKEVPQSTSQVTSEAPTFVAFQDKDGSCSSNTIVLNDESGCWIPGATIIEVPSGGTVPFPVDLGSAMVTSLAKCDHSKSKPATKNDGGKIGSQESSVNDGASKSENSCTPQQTHDSMSVTLPRSEDSVVPLEKPVTTKSNIPTVVGDLPSCATTSGQSNVQRDVTNIQIEDSASVIALSTLSSCSATSTVVGRANSATSSCRSDETSGLHTPKHSDIHSKESGAMVEGSISESVSRSSMQQTVPSVVELSESDEEENPLIIDERPENEKNSLQNKSTRLVEKSRHMKHTVSERPAIGTNAVNTTPALVDKPASAVDSSTKSFVKRDVRTKELDVILCDLLNQASNIRKGAAKRKEQDTTPTIKAEKVDTGYDSALLPQKSPAQPQVTPSVPPWSQIPRQRQVRPSSSSRKKANMATKPRPMNMMPLPQAPPLVKPHQSSRYPYPSGNRDILHNIVDLTDRVINQQVTIQQLSAPAQSIIMRNPPTNQSRQPLPSTYTKVLNIQPHGNQPVTNRKQPMIQPPVISMAPVLNSNMAPSYNRPLAPSLTPMNMPLVQRINAPVQTVIAPSQNNMVPANSSVGPIISNVVGSYTAPGMGQAQRPLNSASSMIGSKDGNLQAGANAIPGTCVAVETQTGGWLNSQLLGKPISVDRFQNLKRDLRKYRPPMPPTELGMKSIKTFTCIGCKDSFLLESSLVAHKERRSMIIKEFCPICNKTIIFYNQCACFEHISKHCIYDTKGVSKLTSASKERAEVHVLPKQLMPDTSKPPDTSTVPFPMPDDDYVDPTKKSSTDTDQSQMKTGHNPFTINDRRSSSEKSQYFTALELKKNKGDLNNVAHTNGTAAAGSDSASTQTMPGGDGTFPSQKRAKCIVCNSQFRPEALEKHFGLQVEGELSKRICTICNMILPNPCSAAAHTRMHHSNGAGEFLCPECGDVIHGTYSIFKLHLEKRCVPSCRIMSIKCGRCEKVFDHVSELKGHLLIDHTDKYFKCVHCPMAFKTKSSYNNHADKVHNRRKTSSADYNYILKCPYCDTVSLRDRQLLDHLSMHLSQFCGSIIYYFKCHLCGSKGKQGQVVFPNKKALFAHLSNKHKFEVAKHMCNYCGVVVESVESLINHKNVVHFGLAISSPATKKDHHANNAVDVASDKVESVEESKLQASSSDKTQMFHCMQCKIGFKRESDFERHMAKHAVKKNKNVHVEVMEAGSPTSNASEKRKTSDEDDSSPAKKKTKHLGSQTMVDVESFPDMPCPECEEVFFASDELDAHMQDIHQVSPQFPCHLCGFTYSTDMQLKQHLKQTHEGKSKEHDFVCWVCMEKNISKGYPKSYMLKQHLITFHKIPRSHIDYSKLESASSGTGSAKSDTDRDSPSEVKVEEEQAGVEPPIKRLKQEGDECYACAKCDYTNECREEFLQHIPKHKTLQESVQCCECGLCFSVQPSLKRHLFMVHKVKDLKKYSRESGVDFQVNPVSDSYLNHMIGMTSSPKKKVVLNGTPPRKTAKEKSPSDSPSPLECGVCYRTFDCETKLRTHMRSHGMAFIRSRRLASRSESPVSVD